MRLAKQAFVLIADFASYFNDFFVQNAAGGVINRGESCAHV